mgnify:CR=1 FL=1
MSPSERLEAALLLLTDLTESGPCDEIAAWEEECADFVMDQDRRASRADYAPSDAQVRWLARLHVRFVRDGLGEDVLDALGGEP